MSSARTISKRIKNKTIWPPSFPMKIAQESFVASSVSNNSANDMSSLSCDKYDYSESERQLLSESLSRNRRPSTGGGSELLFFLRQVEPKSAR